eukprot:CAMPEP_0194324690 /NCGR_PEP_ID=MMETSP0171-20130528/28803_1 /TAXON_ID=218684 /ORGANISM="Corethron pennatum, Strain L29A3" /LENGTH=140 /DNA_ID=CAMNT_0039083653 /DNA_START=1112 /DNA_END=1535 /DNA_ORIENTATION=-
MEEDLPDFTAQYHSDDDNSDDDKKPDGSIAAEISGGVWGAGRNAAGISTAGEVLPNFSEGTGDYTNSAIGGNANAVENSRITGRNTTKISLAWSSAVEISGEAGGITAKNPGVAAENSRSAGRNAAKVSEGAEGGVADNP